MEPLSKEIFPRAIVHFDGDSFFASVEQMLNHTLRGKVVVTGAERGAATSISYEGKRLGIKRFMSLRDIRAIAPNCIVVSSDYTAYSIFAHRMFNIARRFTPHVEEYSIDECFADITGLDEKYNQSYEEIACSIKSTLEEKLGITFGVGLAPTKVLAKTASKYRKPSGFTSIPANQAHLFLDGMPAGSIWGIGPAMTEHLRKLGIHTALQFAQVDSLWLSANRIAKPYRAIWHELRGEMVNELADGEYKEDMQSIMKTRTFSPPSMDTTFLYSQLSKNIEAACTRLRGMHMRTREIAFFIKTQEFLYGTREAMLPVATSDPRDILAVVRPMFKTLFRPGILYRATGITLRSLVREDSVTADLFGESERTSAQAPIWKKVDTLNRRYGKQSVYLASSVAAINHREPERRRKEAHRRAYVPMRTDDRKKSLNLPLLGKAF